MAILPRRRFNPQTMMRNVPPAGLIDPEELGASAIPTPDNGYVPNYGGARPPTPDDIPTPGPMSAGMPPAGPIPEGPAMAQYKAALGENDKETPMWRQILGGALASTRFGRGVAPVVSGEMGRERRRRRVQSLGQAAQLEEQQRQHQANEGIRRQHMDLTGEQIAGARENRQMMGDLRSRQAETDAIAKGWRPLEPGEQAQPGMPTGTIGGRAGVYDLPGMRKREALAKQEAEQAGWFDIPEKLQKEYGLPARGPERMLETGIRMLEADGRAKDAADLRRTLAEQATQTQKSIAEMNNQTRRDIASQSLADRLAARADKPSTGEEKRTMSFALRAEGANKELDAMEGMISQKNLAGQGRLKYAPNWLQSEENQVYERAMREFTEARLRKDSGAAIPPHEFESDAKTYFPQPGDSPDVLKTKKAARARMIDSLKFSSGKAYREYHGEDYKPGSDVQASAQSDGTPAVGGTFNGGKAPEVKLPPGFVLDKK